jgi:multicomponent Na+:H+ antiporter subunit B
VSRENDRRADVGRRPRTDGGVPAVGRDPTLISRTVVRIVVPIILVTAISLLLQGHNLPGGGFIGAVLTATAFVLVYVIFGSDYLRTVLGFEADGTDSSRLVEAYRWMFAAGLAIAAASGLVPILFGYPFLTQAVAFVEHVPLYGELEVASAFAFDLGVYFTVVGALLTVIGEVGSE